MNNQEKDNIHDAAAPSSGGLTDEQIMRIAGDLKQRNAGVWPGDVAFACAVLTKSLDAAAKTEQVPCSYCGGKNGAHDRAYPHPSKDYSASAADTGSAQPISSAAESAELVAAMRERVVRIRYIDESSRALLIKAADIIERGIAQSAATTASAKQAPTSKAERIRDEVEAMKAEIAELRAELAAGAAAGGNTFNSCTSNSFEFNKSGNLNINEAGAAGTVKDAERYRWLRDPKTDVALVLDKQTGWVPQDESIPGIGGYHTYEYRAGEELDAAIDAAIEAHNKAGKEQG